ncbi:MAG TPA: CBS domain-containing protein [Nakamurella sp.]
MRVKDVLARKGAAVATIGPGAAVSAVIASLAEHGIGALVVSSDGKCIEGIVSERDVVRALNTYGAELLGMRVRQIMTADVHTCVPTDEIRTLALTMTDKRFRHMPVAANGVLSGIVTLGDVVKSRVDELETEHEQMVEYISSSG